MEKQILYISFRYFIYQWWYLILEIVFTLDIYNVYENLYMYKKDYSAINCIKWKPKISSLEIFEFINVNKFICAIIYLRCNIDKDI